MLGLLGQICKKVSVYAPSGVFKVNNSPWTDVGHLGQIKFRGNNNDQRTIFRVS